MVKIFSQRSLKTLRNLQAHRSDISGLAIIDEAQKILTASYDGTCRLWNLTSYDAEKTIVKQKERIRSMATTLDGECVFLGFQSGKIKRINIGNVRVKAELAGHTDIVSALSVDPTGQYIASASWDRTLKIWSLEDNSEIATGQLVTGISALAWSTDGNNLYSADQSGSIVSWTSFE
jgi:WD40 repeat protein